MDELLKGLSVFSEGLKQFSTAKAVNDANEQLLALQTQQLDKEQQLAAQTQISQGLAMRLGAAGADASKIQALTSEIAPSQGAQYQAQVNKDLQGEANAFKADESAKDRALQRELAQMKINALDPKSNEKMGKFLVGQADKFYKREQKAIDNLDVLHSLKDLIETNPSQIGIELSKTALLKSVGEDRVSDADINRAINDPSMRQTMKRKLKLELDGQALKDDRKFYAALIGKLESDATKRVREKVRGEADSIKELYPDVDAEVLNSAYTKKIPALQRAMMNDTQKQVAGKQQQDQQKQAQIQAAEAWLASPAAKQNPTKAQAVLKQINRLKSGL